MERAADGWVGDGKVETPLVARLGRQGRADGHTVEVGIARPVAVGGAEAAGDGGRRRLDDGRLAAAVVRTDVGTLEGQDRVNNTLRAWQGRNGGITRHPRRGSTLPSPTKKFE